MELITLLNQHNKILESLLACLEKEKQALIQEDAKVLLEIIEEKKQYISALDRLEKKREETWPGMNFTKLKETGLLTPELKEAREKMQALVKSITELQETNQLLTRQSLLYTNKIINMLQGTQKSTYSATGKIEDSAGSKSILDQSI
jgi:flagellar biosynthesis/type III secretory pathway chaperone